MNRFRLPNHLIIEEGILNNIPVCMKDVFPDLKKAKTILVTTEHLKKLFQNIIEEMLSRSIRLRSTLPFPTRCCCPTNSLRFLGRILAASGCVLLFSVSKILIWLIVLS